MNEEAKQIVEEMKKEVVEQLLPAVTEKAVDSLMEKLADRKDVFGAKSEAQELTEKKAVAAEYLQKLASGQDTKSLTAGGSTSGTELVPTYISESVITWAEQVGLVRRYSTKWPMPGSNVDVPTVSNVSAYRVNEGAKITSSQPTTGAVQLRGKTVGVIIPVSEKLIRNATPMLVDVLSRIAGEAIAKLEDQWGLLGLTSGEGVFQTSGVPAFTMGSGDTTYAKVEAEDLLDTMSLLDDSAYDDKLKWVLSRSVLNTLRKLRAAVGSDKQGFLFSGFGQSLPPSIWDIPYVTSPVMPKTSDVSQANKPFVALANFGHILHGDSRQYTMSISDQATITDTDGTTLINLFEQNMVALKVTGEIDIKLANAAKAFAVTKTAAS